MTDPAIDADLPDGVHATALTAHLTIVWADLPYSACPYCGEPLGGYEVTRCPVLLSGDGDGTLLEVNGEHCCGVWLPVTWATVERGERLTDVARQVADGLAERIARVRAARRAELADDLREALARFAEPLDDGETLDDRADEVTVREDTPGVQVDRTRDPWEWQAWDLDPAGRGEPGDHDITVYAHDLAAN